MSYSSRKIRKGTRNFNDFWRLSRGKNSTFQTRRQPKPLLQRNTMKHSSCPSSFHFASSLFWLGGTEVSRMTKNEMAAPLTLKQVLFQFVPTSFLCVGLLFFVVSNQNREQEKHALPKLLTWMQSVLLRIFCSICFVFVLL